MSFNVLFAVDLGSKAWLNIKRAGFVQIAEDLGKFFRRDIWVEIDERGSTYILVTTDDTYRLEDP
jgi:hypothetical protein